MDQLDPEAKVSTGRSDEGVEEQDGWRDEGD